MGKCSGGMRSPGDHARVNDDGVGAYQQVGSLQ